MRYNYLIVQTSIGDYRQEVVNQLEEIFRDDLKICCGDIYFDNTTKTRIEFKSQVKNLRNIFLFNRKLLIQVGCFWAAIFAKNVVLEMNPRILNTWLIAIIRRLLFKPVVMWGHAWPRAGKSANSDKLRSKLRGLATHIIVYTYQQKIELLEKEPIHNIIVAPNSLYLAKDMYYEEGVDRKDFIYVGRLVGSKKILFLVKAFIEFIKSNNTSANLIIVGDGPEREHCEKLVIDNRISDRVLFKGHVADIELLRQYYSTCIASLSPGYVGLSITQSFAFGVPMIISKDENHSPEIEAAVENVNVLFFKTNDENSLIETFKLSLGDKHTFDEKAKDIITHCQNAYSADVMAQRISLALRKEIIYTPDNQKSIVINFIRGLVRYLRKSKLKLVLKSRLTLGKNVHFGPSNSLQSPQFFIVGTNFSSGANFFVQTNCDIGNDCLISSNVSFVGNDHDFATETQSCYWSGKTEPSTVVLKGNNFIGYGATVVGNVVIGEGAIIGAGSLIIKDVAPYEVVAGVPAKFIRHR